jgi:hypothetical protein
MSLKLSMQEEVTHAGAVCNAFQVFHPASSSAFHFLPSSVSVGIPPCNSHAGFGLLVERNGVASNGGFESSDDANDRCPVNAKDAPRGVPRRKRTGRGDIRSMT